VVQTNFRQQIQWLADVFSRQLSSLPHDPWKNRRQLPITKLSKYYFLDFYND